jgi:large subunit ribosomal protein L25
MESVIEATGRHISGSAGARRLRRSGKLPGVVNTEKGESRLIQMDKHGFTMMLHHHASENVIIDLSIDGGSATKVLVKNVQHDTLSGDLLHVDLMEISMTRKMRIMVPLQLTGEAPGVERGGILEHLLREIEVECLPTDLVECFDVDCSALDIGDSVLVGDLNISSEFTVLTSADLAITHVAAPRVEEESDVAEGEEPEEGEAGAEPEVIGKEGEATAEEGGKR